MNYKIQFQLVIMLFSCSFYAQKSKIPSEIKSIYFQHWQGGQEKAGSGTNFFVLLKKSYNHSINLKKVYFKKSEAIFEKRNDSLMVAYFRYIPNQSGENSDGTTGLVDQSPAKIDYRLNENQAVLEFCTKNRLYHVWVSNIKQIKPLEYSSAPPQNK